MGKQVNNYSQWGCPDSLHRENHTTSPKAILSGRYGMVSKEEIARLVNAQSQVLDFIVNAVAHEDIEIDDELEQELEELSIVDTVLRGQ